MTPSCFLDTNILLYSISQAGADAAKARIALEILDRDDLGLSVQVLQEFYVQATRASRAAPLPHALAYGLGRTWTRFAVQDVTLPVMTHAMEIKERYRLSYWDSAIVATAIALGCDTLMSEDMQHGQQFGRLVVENPFR